MITQAESSSRFVILTQARTGSNMLSSMLDAHPAVRCFGEAFNPGSSFGYENWVQKSLLRKFCNRFLRDYCVETYLDSLLSVKPSDNLRSIGFRVIYPGQFDRWSNFRYYWRTHDFKIISLVRRNLLRKYVSSIIASSEGVWSTQEHRGAAARVEVDLEHFRRNIKRMETIYQLIDTLTIEFRGIQVSYEELSSNGDSIMKTLLEFLGVEEVNVDAMKSKTAQQNPERLSELIANYEEVASALSNTQYGWFLEECENESENSI